MLSDLFRVISTRSSAFWQFWVSMVYCATGFYNMRYPFVNWELLFYAYVIILSLPLWFSPVARWLGMRTIW